MRSINSSVGTVSCGSVSRAFGGLMPLCSASISWIWLLWPSKGKAQILLFEPIDATKNFLHMRPLLCLYCFILIAFSRGRRLWLLRNKTSRASLSPPEAQVLGWNTYLFPFGCSHGQRVTQKGCFQSEFDGNAVPYPMDSICGEWLHFWLSHKCLVGERINQSLCPSFSSCHTLLQTCWTAEIQIANRT